MVDKHARDLAQNAVNHIRRRMNMYGSEQPTIGIILGTGWGDALKWDERIGTIPLSSLMKDMQLDGHGLPHLEGHKLNIVYGRIGTHKVIALEGRVHLNEDPANPIISALVRLQMEMLIHLGVKTFILTAAAGSLSKRVEVGDIVLVDGFVSVFAPPMPLFGGEFCSPDDAILDQTRLLRTATLLRDCPQLQLTVHEGGYAMVRGPFFEGRKYDKRLLAQTGAIAVGMSCLPETCIASLYPEVRVLPIAFITNTADETHSHKVNQERARECSTQLFILLRELLEAPDLNRMKLA